MEEDEERREREGAGAGRSGPEEPGSALEEGCDGAPVRGEAVPHGGLRVHGVPQPLALEASVIQKEAVLHARRVFGVPAKGEGRGGWGRKRGCGGK